MERKSVVKSFWLGAFTALLAAGVVWKISDTAETEKRNEGVITDNFVNKAKLLEEIIEERYIGDVDEELMEADMYKGLMASLGDPYSTYYTSEEYEDLNTETSGSYKGIGVVMQMEQDTGVVKIVRCYKGAPGAEAGLLPEDIVAAVNGESISSLELSEVVDRVKSSEDEIAHLTIAREGASNYLEIDVPLEEVEIPVVSHKILEEDVGYIALYEFTEQTATQYQEAFADLETQGMKRLVIDVRNNPGGLLTSVCNLLNGMVPEGLLVYTEDKDGNQKVITSDGSSTFDMPLVVLVNGNSASASEIFSGVVQDYEIGTIVGTTTFGKGIVQSIIPLTDGSAVKTTTAKYYTPKGRCIHGTGIEPDVEVELNEGLEQKTTLTYEEDNQLQKAVEVVKEIKE